MSLVALQDQEMTITEHLEELRYRLIVSLIAVAIGTGILWSWSGDFLTWLAEPAGGLIFIAPTEAFFTRLKVAMFGGFLLSLPILIYEGWAFCARALGQEMRRGVNFVLPLSYVLFLFGVFLAVFIVVPVAVRFLSSYGTSAVRPMLAVGAYMDFVASLSIAFGAVFQLPLVLMFLQRAGIVTREQMAEKRRYIYFGAFVVAAMLTPGPDVFSQMALAIPMLLLFELSLALLRWTSRQ